MNDIVKSNNSVGLSPAELEQNVLSYLGNFSNLKKEQAEQFIGICKAFQLNPFTREIYGIPYGNKFSIIVGYEVYLKRAERSGMLKGWKVWVENGEKACIEIHRKDWSSPFYHEVMLSEYKQQSQIWKSKPQTMLKKVAMAQGFRLAFPVELGGIPYTADELPDKMSQPVQQPKQEVKQPEQQPEAKQEVKPDNYNIDVLKNLMEKACLSNDIMLKFLVDKKMLNDSDKLENLTEPKIARLVNNWDTTLNLIEQFTESEGKNETSSK